jgi:signal transduction histidine kinase
MNQRIVRTLTDGFQTAVLQPRFLILFALLVILPLLFLYSGQQFLDAGIANQEKLLRDQVDTLHDSFSALITATTVPENTIPLFISTAVENNLTIEVLRYVRELNGEFMVVASFQKNERGIEATEDAYRSAQVRFGETTIFPFLYGGDRYWQAVRAFRSANGETSYILSIHSLEAADRYIQNNEYRAYFVLIGVYLIIVLVAWWHLRQVDFEHRFRAATNAIATRDQFTNVVAHELRAPLTAIRGYASMIVESVAADPESKSYANTIEQSAARLLTIVNDLLEVARLQSGTVSLTMSRVALLPVVEQVCTELRSIAQEKGLTLTIVPSSPCFVLTDKDRLAQVCTNLVSNSIKYTAEGGVTIRIGMYRNEVEIRIEDTGMGIAAEDQQKLFAPFFRVESDTTREIVGTGLGMWITKQLLEQMRAKVTVESIKGVGTHVIVRLPSA